MTITAQSFLPDFVIKQGLVNPSLTRGADFEAYTGSMRIDPNADTGRYIVNMVGSSTIKDLQGDIMLMSALDDMTKVPDNLTLLLNHNMDIPDSIFGGLVGRPWIQSSNGIADLHLTAEVEQSNPKAMQTYAMISGGRRLGCSIGCMVLDYDIDLDTDTILIRSVLPVEYSVVSVPANMRCWVEIATKSLFERSLLEGHADKALQLAPAVRGMYKRQYDSLVKHVQSDSLRNDLEYVRPRDTASQRIICVLGDGETQFALMTGRHNVTKSLKRDEVGRVLEEHLTVKSAKPTTTLSEPVQEDVTQTNTIESEDLDTKSVSGNTSFPLMNISTEWTGSKAESQIFAYAKGDDGEINVSKAKGCFLWYDPDNSDKQSGYKLPMTYIVSGSPKIVPLGVRAVAGALSGARGGALLGGDDAGVKAKVKTLYGRINSQFKPDPEWVVPWEKDDKSVEDEEMLTKAKEKDGIADSNSDAPLNRQDLGEEAKTEENKDKKKGMPQASDVKVSADGTHEACTGSHSHSHKSFGSQGQDEQHKHKHSHDGDSNHDHSHNDDQKATEPEVTKSQEDVQVPEETATEGQTVSHVDPKKLSLLSIYNNLGAELGFAEVTLDQKQKGYVPLGGGIDPQEVITALSLIDTKVDWLMAVFGVPDIDEPPAQGMPGMWSIDEASLTTKDGREISNKNMKRIKAIHDHASAMVPEVCSMKSETVDEATDEARMQGEGQPIQQYPSMAGDTLNNSIEAIDKLTKSLESVTVKSIVESVVGAALDESRHTLETLRQEQRTLIDNIRKLKEMPLGRPTTLVGRTVVQEEGVASYDEMRQAGINMLEQSEDDLEVVTRGSLKYRLWPKGFRSGQRPLLSEMQKTYMSPLDYAPYMNADRDVLVPIDEHATAQL